MPNPQRPMPVSLTVALAVACVISAIGVVYAKHEARKSFNELQQVSAARDELNIEWGRLQIEQSTFATHGRVERVATEELALARPGQADVFVISDE